MVKGREMIHSECVRYRCCEWLNFLELKDMRMLKINSSGLRVFVDTSNLMEDHNGTSGNDLVNLKYDGKR